MDVIFTKNYVNVYHLFFCNKANCFFSKKVVFTSFLCNTGTQYSIYIASTDDITTRDVCSQPLRSKAKCLTDVGIP